MNWPIKIYNILRSLTITLLVICVAVPCGLYVILSTPWAQEKLRTIGQEQLSRVLDTEVSIGHVDFSPFDRIVLSQVTVKDDNGRDALKINTLSSRFEVGYFISTGRLSFDYAVIDGMDAHLYKASHDAPLNIARIIEHLKPKDKSKPPTKFEFEIGTVKITNSTVSYDILDVPRTPEKFNPSHISVSGLNLLAYLPEVTNEGLSIDLPELNFNEASGLGISNISLRADIFPGNVSLTDPTISLNNSCIKFKSISLRPGQLKQLADVGRNTPLDIAILPGSYITLSDLAPLVPKLKDVNRRFDVNFEASGLIDDITINHLSITEHGNERLMLTAQGNVKSLTHIDSLTVNDFDFYMHTQGDEVAALLSSLRPQTPAKTCAALASLGFIDVTVNASGSTNHFSGQSRISTTAGEISFDGEAQFKDKFRDISTDAHIDIYSLDIQHITANKNLGQLSASLDIDADIKGSTLDITLDADIADITFKDVHYNDILLSGHIGPDKTFDVSTSLTHDTGLLELSAQGSYSPTSPSLIMTGEVSDLDLNAMNLTNRFAGYKISGTIDADLQGNISDWINGHIGIYNIAFVNSDTQTYPPLYIDRIVLTADNDSHPSTLSLQSDFINGQFEGQFDITSLPEHINSMLKSIIPAFIGDNDRHLKWAKIDGQNMSNKFTYEFAIDNTDKLTNFLHLPVRIIYPLTINGLFDSDRGEFNMSLDAPYLLQGEKLIENTALQVEINSPDSLGRIYATTQMPTKKGTMVLVAGMTATDNRIDSRIDWQLQRDKPVGGLLAFSTLLGRDANGEFTADVNFNPCDINFGNDTWHIAPSHISYARKDMNIEGFSMSTNTQSISIDGRASTSPDDTLTVKLKDIELINIFETLDINKALLGGTATGSITASGLFSPAPDITARSLTIDSISYNYCVLGNAVADACWNIERRAVDIDADLTEPEGGHSYIKGSIMPFTEELDITFDANNVRVGFMKPFMAAFAEDITGHASGHAHLFGSFKYIDLEGDILARDLGVKIAFTNTWYYTTDSVHITPGNINIDDVVITDPMGHKARLKGYVRHTFFKDPVFDFAVTDAENLLSYDVTPKLSPDWYGRIFGNGSAFINGHPGVVNINVNMTTAPESTFTFVLSDQEEADEYTFITFRDRNAGIITDSITEIDRVPQVVREIQRRAHEAAKDSPSDYNMDIQVEITPVAKLTIVMDPVGGDEIKATGSGNLRMTYSAPSNDLKMYGNYTIERGTYNFTLQDIIVKDFIIKDGSSISFTGDPYSARLDIKAAYAVNANLSDLDESFLQDKDLNRTNVPVNALLLVKGDMRQPDISFDLEFPTLTSDTYRKVRSIISTDEMMDRQIIYLLALNRFYTPEYMSATKGNELFSVASSTISSRLTSMLGKLSDNWTIAPNLRSDKGDFSDVEFDVALSSTLLNNRLRLNGNLGYRDKSLNSNQFIGDFDIEYLLTPTGTWRLKAYNRYNDQNYYLRTAQTTQGVGIMYRRDFDKLFNFLKPRKKIPQQLNDKKAADDSLVVKKALDTSSPPSSTNDSIDADKTASPTQTTDWISFSHH